MNINTQTTISLAGIWTCNIVSIAVAIAFLVRYYRIPQKTCASHMILVLSLMTWIMPIIDLPKLFITTNAESAKTVAAFEMASNYLTVHWTAILAIYTYKKINDQGQFYEKTFIGLSALWCITLMPIIALPIYHRIWDIYAFFNDKVLIIQFPLKGFENKVLYFLSYEAIGMMVPLFMNLYYYSLVHKYLKSYSNEPRHRLSKVLWIGIIPILCISPAIIADVVCMSLGIFRPFAIKILESCLFRSWGFINLIAYWLPKSSESSVHETMIDDTQAKKLSQGKLTFVSIISETDKKAGSL